MPGEDSFICDSVADQEQPPGSSTRVDKQHHGQASGVKPFRDDEAAFCDRAELLSTIRALSACASQVDLLKSGQMCVARPDGPDQINLDCDWKAKDGRRSSLRWAENRTDGRDASPHVDRPNHKLPFKGTRHRRRFSMSPSRGQQPGSRDGEDGAGHNESQEASDSQSPAQPAATFTSLVHRLRCNTAILALAVSNGQIYAGTQKGQILTYSLETFERVSVVHAHRNSVLGLCLSEDERLLFSSAGDRIVNVWNTKTFARVYSLVSSYDVGDVFCIAYSSLHQTVYLGAQNTSIQWYDLENSQNRPVLAIDAHPPSHRFFDSLGPGGLRTPPPLEPDREPLHAVGGLTLEIPKQHMREFAHFGYVYCMTITRHLGIEGGRELLVSGGGDGITKLWTINDSEHSGITELFDLEDGRESGDPVLTLAVDGTFLYSGREDGEVNVWNLETKQLVRSLKARTGDVLTLCVGGGLLFSAGMDGIVDKFDRRYNRIASFQAHNGRILASAFTVYKQHPVLITGGNDHSIAVWNIKDCVEAAPQTQTTDEQLSDSLKQFVSYRTVSSDPQYKVDCHRGASFLRSLLKNLGARTEMIATEANLNPIIVAKFKAAASGPEKPSKVLFYGHYDVIAAENERGLWICDPFSMEGIDGYLYGRGVSDNKGPIMAAIYAVAELVAEKALNTDVTFVLEGEEETGSRGFEDAIRKNKEIIGDVDWVLLANSYWLDDHVPCLTYGLRGVIHATVQVDSRHPDLHSGVDGSALLDESLKDLVMLLAKLTGKNGHVEIPGFYDPIPALDDEERQLYDDITRTLLQRNPDLGEPDELALSLMRRWREASLTIHRFQTSGPENSTIIPRLARAAISMRLVPNQEADDVAQKLTKFLHSEFSKLESKNRLTVTIDHKAEPWLGDFRNELFATLEKAIMLAWGPLATSRRPSMSSTKGTRPKSPKVDKSAPATSSTLANGSAKAKSEASSPASNASQKFQRPLYIREGGSIPAVRFLEKEFGAPAAHLPCGQASDSAHLNNERLRLLNLYKSKDIFKFLFHNTPRR